MENQQSQSWHGTTIISVRKGNQVVVAGDGQVSLGNTVIKGTAQKVRKIGDGIGFSISKLIVENGGKVYLTDIDQKKINKISRNIKYKNKIFANQLDANNYNQVKQYFKSLSNLKKIDGLINNVGIAGPTKYLEKTLL